MRVFVTGATGFIGSAVVQELLRHGHQVVGLARSETAAAELRQVGVVPHRGSVEDLASLRAGAAGADAAVHAAFFHQFSHARTGTRLRVVLGGSPRGIVNRFLSAALDTDRLAITTIGRALSGTGPALVAAFGTMALTPGQIGTEDQDTDLAAAGGPRGSNERGVLELADAGVRASVLRLPPVVHGDGDRAGFIPQLVTAAGKNALSGYVGEGRNRWAAVHRLDAAALFVQALEEGKPGARYHAVAEEGIPFLDIATAIGQGAGVPVAAVPAGEVAKRFGFVAPFVPVDNPTTSELTRHRLGWQPVHRSLGDDLADGTYFAR